MTDLVAEARRYYDANAHRYDTRHGVVHAGQWHNFARYYEPFLSNAIPGGARVLELGCGTGVYTRWLLDRGCRVVGMDISPRILDEARRRCPGAVLVQGDCADPASFLPDGALAQPFDVILGVNTFSYYPGKSKAMRRYRELVRVGGRIVLMDMNGACPLYRIMTWAGKNELRTWYQEVKHNTERTLARLVRDAQMEVRAFAHFAFIPNGVGSGVVGVLRPLDAMLHRVPGMRRLAMRVGLVAERT